MRTGTAAIVLCSTALAIPAVAAPAAQAKGDDDRVEIERVGSCTGAADWKLQAKERDGGLEVEWEVDSNRAGQRWKYRMWRNGVRFAKGTKRTTARSGSFSIERRTSDGGGRDVISAKAKHRGTGQVCRASLVI